MASKDYVTHILGSSQWHILQLGSCREHIISKAKITREDRSYPTFVSILIGMLNPSTRETSYQSFVPSNVHLIHRMIRSERPK